MWSDIVGLREGDRYLIVNPFFHTFGYKAGILACLMRGATIVPHAVFDAGQVMRRIGEEKITVLPGPPTLYQSILNDPARAQHDLSSLRLAVTGAAVVPVELIKRMHDELTFETILTAYGLTESTGTATMCRPDDDAETIANTSGITASAMDNIADWIGAGIDPERSTIFIQSLVPEHAELYLLLQMVTPISWLAFAGKRNLPRHLSANT